MRGRMPARDPISMAAPTPYDLMCSEKLMQIMSVESPQENEEEQYKRQRILSTITALFKDWVRSVYLQKELPEEMANNAGGLLLTSGSYRLNLNERGIDIDTLCVAPRFVTRDDFFTTLKVILEDLDEVTNLIAVETALVPVITFDFEDVNIDLLFAQLPLDAVPEDTDVNDDAILRGVDPTTEKSLNGPRVTNRIVELVPNRESFIALLRCVRLWAKRRGIYKNKMGYLGGVNCNILSAFICQLYPNASPATLLERFFYVLRDWNWPTPIEITPQYDAGLGHPFWQPGFRDVMPILTPAYPSMNSSYSVSQNTLEVMVWEMGVAHQKVRAALANNGEGWSSVFEPSDFAVAHSRYLAAEIYVRDVPEHERARMMQTWTGFIEARLRGFVERFSGSRLPIQQVRLVPKELSYHWPLTTGHLPLTTHHSPLTTHHSHHSHRSPLTTHRSPLTTYRLPYIAYHLPPTTYRLLPI